MGQQWYVGYPDRVDGPLTARELADRARAGRVRPEDKVSRDRKVWYLARQVKNLAFGPPPAATVEVPTRPELVTPVVTPAPRPESLGAMRLAAGSVIPGYEVLEQLGAGGMGVVYKARQVKLDRIVALKTVIVPPQGADRAVARFEQEAHAVAKLQHPHIVAAYDFGHHDGALYFVMELLTGETLEERLDRGGRLDEAEAWGLARQAAAGLAHAARHGIVHRDIKPANLFLVEAPTGMGLPPGLAMVKLTDFGLARFNDPAPQADRLTAAGTVLGTPIYMAPEQFSGEPADVRSDIYSLGATVYHMLAGKPPFEETDTVWSVMVQKMEPTRAIDLPLGTSAGTLRLVADMMTTDPARRVPDYDELLRRIDDLVGPGPRPASQYALERPASQYGLGRSASQYGTEPVVAVPGRRPLGKWAVPMLAAVGGGLVLAVAASALLPGRPSPALPELVPSSRIESLFDGQSLAGWTMSGAWSADKDREGAPVISGKGEIRRRLPTYENYLASVGADVGSARAVEVQFAVAVGPPESAPRYVVRMSPQEGVRAGVRRGDGGAFEPTGGAMPYPPAEDLADRAPYLELSFERRRKVWVARFEGKNLAVLPDDGTPKYPELRLAAEGGVARFDRVDIDELIPPELAAR